MRCTSTYSRNRIVEFTDKYRFQKKCFYENYVEICFFSFEILSL